ncbi:MAG: beta-galactosidase [Chthoniobacteraceae bacterium]
MLQNTHLYYGGDYNPEQWPESVWQEDARLMQTAGVNLVSLGIFSWAKLEPSPGRYEFDWLDRVIDLLHRRGIAVDLATATASPPAWLVRQHPEILPQDANGTVLHPGSRQHYCPNSPHYREAAAALTRQLAQHYQHHPAVVMWHINNEYGCHVAACFCDRCAAAFRGWLKVRYATLDVLNEAWGTAFWSQWYGDWEEIFPPRKTPTMANPAQQIDYKHFYSDSVLALYRREYDIIKEHTPNLPVTTNFMGFFGPFDYYQWARHVDFTSWDSYPDPNDGVNGLAVNAAAHDLTRSLGRGEPFLLMEQVPSQVSWRPVNSLKPPGQMRLHSYQAVARGADGVLFFQWRAARAGAEKYHGAMVPHVGAEHSRVFREVADLGRELQTLDALAGSRVRAKVGIVFDYPNWWALNLESKPAQLDYLSRVLEYHRFFYDANLPVDFLSADGDWSGYRLVLAPHLCQLRTGVDERIRNFVRDGGTFLTTYFSGITDENEHIILGGYAGKISDLLGIWVEEWDPQPPGRTLHVQWADGTISEATDWCDLVHLKGASALAVLTDHFIPNTPAVTQNAYGKGQAYYLAAQLDAAMRTKLLSSICRDLDLEAPVDAPPGVEATLREKNGSCFLFLLNHTTAIASVDLKDHAGRDLLSGKTHSGPIKLQPRETLILHLD